MPIVRVELWEGRSMEEKEDLIKKVTDAVVDSVGVNPNEVFVILSEVPKAHWGVEGKPSSKRG